ncbi:MAG: high-potential iron-sulfur protein [Pseudomonadota bacterium]
MATDIQRRTAVKLATGAAIALPLSGLVACSGDEGTQATDATKSTTDRSAVVTNDALGATEKTDKAAVHVSAHDLSVLSEDDPIAVALSYKHDATKIDLAKYPGRGAPAGESCGSCVLYVARDRDWGACDIFAGEAVNSSGWCNAYRRR